MKKLLKNKPLISVICIILALILNFGIAPMITSQATKQIQVTRVAQGKEIPPNTKITDDLLETVTVSSLNLPTGVIQNKSEIVNQYSTIKMVSGDWFFTSKLSAKPLGADEYLTKLDGKKVALSVSIKSFAAGLSGKLQTGDIISLDVADYGDMKQTITPGDLQYVQLLAATTDTGTDNNRTTADKSSNKNNTSTRNEMPSTLTVLVSPEQKKRLVDFDANGIIYASLVYRGNAQTAQQFIAMQDKYLAEQGGKTTNEQ